MRRLVLSWRLIGSGLATGGLQTEAMATEAACPACTDTSCSGHCTCNATLAAVCNGNLDKKCQAIS